MCVFFLDFESCCIIYTSMYSGNKLTNRKRTPRRIALSLDFCTFHLPFFSSRNAILSNAFELLIHIGCHNVIMNAYRTRKVLAKVREKPK